MKSDLVDLELRIHHETAKAILASDTGDKDKAVWIPKSIIEIESTRAGTYIVTMPQRFAAERGLV